MGLILRDCHPETAEAGFILLGQGRFVLKRSF